jgi:HK97 family phage major capsid protein
MCEARVFSSHVPHACGGQEQSDMDPKILRERANKLATDMRALLDKATSETRELTNEERQTFDKMDADRDVLLADEARILKAAQLEQGEGRQVPASQPAEYRAGNGGNQAKGKVSERDRAFGLAGWLLGGKEENRAEFREAAQRIGMSPTSKNLTMRLADTPLRSLHRDDVKQWEERIVKDVVSPDGGGHFTLSINGLQALEVALLQFGGMRQVSTVVRTDNGNDLQWPTTNDTSNSGALLGETLEHTELDITFDDLVLNAYKYTSRLVKVSVEYLQDNAINAPEVIGRLLGERIGRITNTHFTTGDGSAKPNGIMTAATSSSITTSGAATISYDNIVDLVHSVDPAYRSGARFMFNDTTLKILKKIKVAQFSGDSGGYPLWRAGFATGEPDTIDGFPYTINQQVASGTGTRAIAFGQLSKYMIRDVKDITLVRLDERYAEFGQVGFLAFSRHDGDLLDAGTRPVKYLTMG